MSTKKIYSIGKDIIEKEIKGLKALKSSLNEDFSKAVELILDSKKNIILTGLGKSGYIARKVSSSFKSTGISSLYLHPSEASHGDLGIIDKRDILIIISNSGETNEILDIINFAKLKGINIISITSNTSSILSRNSTVVLKLPKHAEADKLKIIPTTSTTMALAMGDALCCAVLNYRKFDKSSFKNFHPGGKLGKNLKVISDIMSKDLPTVGINETISEAILVMTEKKYGCVIVCNHKNIILGIITDGDLRRSFKKGLNYLNTCKIKDIMNSKPVMVKENILVTSAINLMNKRSITSLIVSNKRKPIGIVNLKECTLSV